MSTQSEDDDYDLTPDDDFGFWDEPIGSCENCGTNLYAGDGREWCDQCEWFAVQNQPKEENRQ